MKVDEALYLSMRRWALKCAHKIRFAVPKEVIVGVLKEFPKLEDDRGELMEEVRKVCTEVNKLKDTEIAAELERNSGDETVIYE